MSREVACSNCGSAIRPAMVRCRECGQLVLEEGLSLSATVEEFQSDECDTANDRETDSQRSRVVAPAESSCLTESVFQVADVDDEFDDDEVLEVQPDTFDDPEPEDCSESESQQTEDHQAEELGPVTEPASNRSRAIVIRSDSPLVYTAGAAVLILCGTLFLLGRALSRPAPETELAAITDTGNSDRIEAVQVRIEDIASIEPASDSVSTTDVPSASGPVESKPAADAMLQAELKAENPAKTESTPEAIGPVTANVEGGALTMETARVLAKPNAPNAIAALPVAELLNKVERACVRVNIQRADGESSLGSGFLCRDTHTVVTNFHVVEDCVTAHVVFHDGTATEIVGFELANPEYDLAVLRVADAPETCVTLDLLATLPEKGTPVYAYGAPKGLSGSLTNGTVSAVRSWQEIRNEFEGGDIGTQSTASLWVQTTAPVSQGNSGGPLLDPAGRVVGMNTWKLTVGQSLNFALASKDIRQLLPDVPGATLTLANLPAVPRMSAAPTRHPVIIEALRVLSDIDLQRERLISQRDEMDPLLIEAEGAYKIAKAEFDAAQQNLATLNNTINEMEAKATKLKAQINSTNGDFGAQSQLNSLEVSYKFTVSQKVSAETNWKKLRAVAEVALAKFQLQARRRDELQRQADELREEWLREVSPFEFRLHEEPEEVDRLFSEWIKRDIAFAPAYIYRGISRSYDQDEQPQARADIDRALQLEPTSAVAMAAKAFILYRSGGNRSVVRSQFAKARTRDRDNPFPYMLQGWFYRETGDFNRAKADFVRACSYDTAAKEAHIWCADLLATCPDERVRDGKQALAMAEKICERVKWNRWDAVLAYASAHAEMGNFDEAIKHAQRAIAIAPEQWDEDCRQRLREFEGGRPWRLPDPTTN